MFVCYGGEVMYVMVTNAVLPFTRTRSLFTSLPFHFSLPFHLQDHVPLVGWTLYWSGEFNGTLLDTSKWRYVSFSTMIFCTLSPLFSLHVTLYSFDLSCHP